MFTVFWDNKGVLLVDFMLRGTTNEEFSFPIKHLRGMKFASDETVVSFLFEVTGFWFEEGLQKFVVRMRKVVEKNGDYIEK